MKRLCKLSLVAVLVLSFTLSPLFATPAKAQWVVYDPANFAVNTITATASLGQQIKEGGLSGGFGLDAIAWFIVNTIIERMAASTVNWINSGFQGSPAFITNPDSYFKNLADGIAGEIIYNHPDFKFMCSPFKAQVQIALARAYMQPRQFQCTLTQIGNNWDNFMNDFSAGGWDGFIQLTQNDQNNPLGLYLQLQSQMSSEQAKKNADTQNDLNRGRGFLSFESCDHRTVATKRTVVTSGRFELQSDGTNKFIPGETKEVEDHGKCLDSSVKTPGSVIESQLNKTLGVGQDRLVAADEINEIITALLNQLTKKALGGLSSLVKGNSQNGEKNYLDQLENATTKEQNFLTTTPVNGQCPAGYTLSEDETGGTCYSSSSIQSSIASGNAAIQNAKKTGPGVFNCKDTSCFASEEDSGNATSTRGADRIGIPTTNQYGNPVNSNPNCGDAATLYPTDASGFQGNFCPVGTTLITPRIQFPGQGDTVAWQCVAYVNNVPTYNNCTATVKAPPTP